jgi:hypothetical protein
LDGFSIINGLAWNEDGGGILCYDSSPKIRNCIIKNNSAELHMIGGGNGGGIALINSGAKIFNCAIISNSSDFYGGGIYGEVGDNATITNCTISGNSGSGGLYNLGIEDGPVVTNSIIWGNSSGSIVNDESGFGSVIATYTDVQGGYPGTGNINTNPLFVTGPKGDYYLSEAGAGQDSNSPCIDAGSDTAANIGLDEYTTRTDQMADAGIVDMGYHYVPLFENVADINEDWYVNEVDLLLMALQWLETPGIPSADIAPDPLDNFVNGLDFAVIQQNWQWPQ